MLALIAAGAWSTRAHAYTVENHTDADVWFTFSGATSWLAFIPAGGAYASLAGSEQRALIRMSFPDEAAKGEFACKVSLPADGTLKVERLVLDGVRGGETPDYRCTSYTAGGSKVDEEPRWAGRLTRDVRFLATADPQYWADGAPNEPDADAYNNWANRTLREMRERLDRSPMLRGALVAGDLTQDTKQWEWDAYLNAISDSDFSGVAERHGARRHWFDTLGNHDLLMPLRPILSRDLTTRARTTVAPRVGHPELDEGLYSWDWHDVHFVSAGEHAAKPRNLGFLRDDLRSQVGASGRPVVILQHFGFDSFSMKPEWWSGDDRKALWEAIADYNVVAFITGHAHLWADSFFPANEPATWAYSFWNPAKADGSDDPQACSDSADCIPSFVAGAARQGVYLSATIDDSCKQKWHEACLSITRHGLDLYGPGFREDGSHRLRIPVRAPDKTPPRAQPTLPESSTGWYRFPTVTWNWTDEQSGIDPNACEMTSRPTFEGAPTTIRGSCSDMDGNTEMATLRVNVDATPPSITLAKGPPSGWTKSDVTVEWTCRDDRSGVLETTISKTVATEGANQSVTGTCTDHAGNTASRTQAGISIDKTPPSITLASRPPANANGWYRADVTLEWSCADELSGVDVDFVQATVDTEGSGQTAAATCTDRAGNANRDVQTAINLDKTAPAIEIATPAADARYELEQHVQAAYGCGDGPIGSGVVSCTGDLPPGAPLDTSSAGPRAFAVAARDAADNEATRTVRYVVRKALTALGARPLLLDYQFGSVRLTIGRVSAKLTYGPSAKPAVGRRVDFTAGSQALCSATAGADGVASCTFAVTGVVRSALELGYTATFAGDANLLPSSASGPVAEALGSTIP